jgi:hypothetical protein
VGKGAALVCATIRSIAILGQPMKKRLAYLLWIMALVVGVVGLFVWARNIPTKEISINRSTYERITKGMTLKEVEELIGLPPGYYGPDLGEDIDVSNWDYLYDKAVAWWSFDCVITISLSAEDVVLEKSYDTLEFPTETFWEKLHRWFALW